MDTEDRKTGVNSIAELIEADEHSAKRRLVQIAAGGLIGIGLLFTGYLNFMLYSRAFPDNMKIFGLIPALLLEGSLALFLLGSFVWFAHGVQGTLAKIFGWLMFAIVGLNTVIEFNTLTGGDATSNEFLQIYAFWGVPLVLVLAIAFWKAVIDADPSVQIMRQRRKIQQTLQVAKMNAEINALGSEESRLALQVFGERSAADVNRRLIGDGAPDQKGHSFFRRETKVIDSPQTLASEGAGWPLPKNWKQMSADDQTAWSLTRNLEEEFPGHTFTVTMQPFNVRVNEDGADLKAVQAAVQDWFDHADGTKIVWGEPVHVEAESRGRGRPKKSG